MAVRDALELGAPRTVWLSNPPWLTSISNSSTLWTEVDTSEGSIDAAVLRACEGRVLDVGAGAGRVALALAGQGLDVTAIDIDPCAVELMRSRGLADARLCDAWELPDERWDTIVLAGHNLGICGSVQNVTPFLRHLAARLRRDGHVLVHSTNEYAGVLAIDLPAEEVWALVLQHEISYPGAAMCVLEYGEWRGKPFPWLWLDAELLAEAARDAGLHMELLIAVGHEYVARLRVASP